MDHGQHFVIGLVVFFVYNFFNNTIITSILHPLIGFSVGTIWLIGAFFAVFGAVIPDQLEPATHWTHRKIFHSKRTLKISGWIFIVTAILALFNPLFYYISCFFAGYVSHLIADSTTKVGLPE